jgi:hypothetical protein
MASKKGVVITGIILAAITGASFLSWIIPQDYETTFVVSDYESYLDGVKNIQEVLEESVDIEYQNLRSGKTTPQEYITVIEVTSSQVTTQISEFVASKPSEEWQTSYISYMNAMMKFNSYITETKVLANLIENAGSEEKMNETLEKIDLLKTEYRELIKNSEQARPR